MFLHYQVISLLYPNIAFKPFLTLGGLWSETAVSWKWYLLSLQIKWMTWLLGRIGQFIDLGGNIKIGRYVAIVHIIGNVNTFCMFLMHFFFFFVFLVVVILIKKFLLPIPMFCILFPIFLKFQNYIKLSLLWWHEHLFHNLNLLHHDILGDSKFFLFSVGLICKFLWPFALACF